MGEGSGFLSSGVPVRTSQWPMDDFIPCVRTTFNCQRTAAETSINEPAIDMRFPSL